MTRINGRLEAPFTPDQVEALNRFQRAGLWHAFTCGNDRMDEAHQAYQREHGGDYGELIATEAGWICPVPSCDYVQIWAHPWMADTTLLRDQDAE